MKTFCIAFFLFVAFHVSAQDSTKVSRWSVGLEGGYAKNYLITNVSSLSFSELRPRSGYTISVPVQFRVKRWFALQAAPGVIQKKYEFDRTGYFAGTYQQSSNTYFQLPLMARFYVGEGRLRGFFDVGGYGAYWMAARANGSIPNFLDANLQTNQTGLGNELYYYSYSEKYHFNSTRDNRFEFGWIAGAGLSWRLFKDVDIYAAARNVHSLADQQKKYQTQQIPKYNQTYTVTLGVLVNVSAISRTARKKN